MEKIKDALKTKTFWATAGVLAGALYGGAGTALVGAVQTIACTVQTCV